MNQHEQFRLFDENDILVSTWDHLCDAVTAHEERAAYKDGTGDNDYILDMFDVVVG